ncbi:MAG TPA: acyltransferase [Quisquiliibacterium sp.]|nr:acyltransferase [Quisquiliibacterium sp.]
MSGSLSQPPAAGGRLEFPAVDVLRAIAALLVLVYHVIEIGRWTGFPVTGPLLVVRAGWIGVDLFFVISGFVIGLSALQGHAREGAAFRAPFARRRLARIVPLYALTALAFLLLVEPSLLSAPLRTLATHLGSHALFLHNLHPNTHGSINGPNWSVALEMQFYAAMMFAAPWLARSTPLRVLPALVLLAWAWRAAVAWFVGPGVDHAHLLHVYSSQLPGTLDAFGFGIVLAMAIAGGHRSIAAMLAQSWRNFALWSLAFAVLFAAAMEVYWPRASYWDRPAMIVLWRTLLAASFCCLVAAAVALPAQRALALRPLRYLGEISYGIYLWHLPVLLTMVAVPGLAGERLMWRVLACTLVLAAFSWHFFERPFVRRAHQRPAPG